MSAAAAAAAAASLAASLAILARARACQVRYLIEPLGWGAGEPPPGGLAHKWHAKLASRRPPGRSVKRHAEASDSLRARQACHSGPRSCGGPARQAPQLTLALIAGRVAGRQTIAHYARLARLARDESPLPLPLVRLAWRRRLATPGAEISGGASASPSMWSVFCVSEFNQISDDKADEGQAEGELVYTLEFLRRPECLVSVPLARRLFL